MREKIEFFKALSVFTSTVIGVGIFGLPYIALQAGFFVVLFYFIVLAFLAIVIHFLLGEVSRDTYKIARIPGYAEEYLGKGAKKFALAVSSLGLMGALLAYLIVGSRFFYLFLFPYFGGLEIFYLFVYFISGAFIIYKGIKAIAYFELVMLVVFFVILSTFFFRGFNLINLENFFTFNPDYWALPYGAILFSLWGLALVPEVKEMVNRDRKKLRWVLSLGIIISAVCYLFFIFIFLGVSGQNTTPDAISGFGKTLGNGIIKLGFIFGLITTFTSFIALGLTLKKIFLHDLNLSKKVSWFIACFCPLLLYFIGFKNFIKVIGLTGAVMLGLEAIIVLLIYKNFIQKRFHRKVGPWIYPLAVLFLIGVFLELFYYFR